MTHVHCITPRRLCIDVGLLTLAVCHAMMCSSHVAFVEMHASQLCHSSSTETPMQFLNCIQIPCPRGYHCKTGSTKPTKCPPLMTCPEKSEVPSDNYAGMVLDLAMFVGLWVVWMLYRW